MLRKNFSITRRIFLGYITIIFLMVIVSIYVISSLRELNLITYTILKEDFQVIILANGLFDTLLDQERNEKKFFILHDPASKQLFWERGEELRDILSRLREVCSPGQKELLLNIESLHRDYEELFRPEVNLRKEKEEPGNYDLSEKLKEATKTLAEFIMALKKSAENSIDVKMKLSSLKGGRAIRVTLILCGLSFLIGIPFSILITYRISSPIKKLKEATYFIARGNFDYDLQIERNDEVGELARLFKNMAGRLKELEKMNLDANPLTRLPGNVAIENTLQKILQEKRPFALCHVDLDNFKAFADKYGYAWASEVIKEVANILSQVVYFNNDSTGFLGHIGGDDFVVITTPDKLDEICSQIIKNFDEKIPAFYNESDRKQKFFVSKDRKGKEQKFPLMSITIAVITNENKKFESPLQIAEMAAELKEYAKTLPGSNYVRDENFHG